MIDPVDVQRIVLATLAAGAAVLFGACYAIFLALSRLRDLAVLRRLSNLSYLALAVSVLALAWYLRLAGGWLALVVILLVGYYLAPRFIWRLSVATHDSEEDRKGGSHD
ncbi:MAG: hypothetical protein OXH27_08945 [Gammaproteobacteria bacterium]|nr:hypothetical protein [Gammaproteobacteria bacterium]MCY3687722.1 hypothetical protein [Gammaproteobacteria bacterium]MDE0479518.1 hypothetical protein [Gammaproteobacteria bacterium]MDE0509915.1 hypothetical protein [Gammaproteobacteria bacterium]MXX07421.1 hypothetical protein [Gammaproteobacteria bacterium]